MLYIFVALAGPPTAGSGTSTSGMGAMPGMVGTESGSSSGMPTLHASTLALLFALLLIAFAVHDLDRQAGVDGYFPVVGRRPVTAGPAPAGAAADPAAYTAKRLLLSPVTVKGCQVAIGITIAFLLLITI